MTAELVERYRVAILGSGFSGLAMAIRLKQAGIHDFVVLEKGDDVGGTWRENTYPGAACDVPSHLYCFSFEPKSDWSRAFAPQAEILAYLQHCADKYGVRPHVRFGTRVVSADFDDATGRWLVRAEDGRAFEVDFLVSGKGGLHVPMIPDFKGRERVEVPAFHSAEWDHALDLTNQRVAVIGSGASAIQIVPALASKVARVDYWQRTPSWVLPRRDYVYSEQTKRRFAEVPALAWLHRESIYWRLEPTALFFTKYPDVLKVGERIARRHIIKHVRDPALREKLTPKYRLGCKRALLSDEYYQAVTRPNVDVITDGLRELRARSIVDAQGREREVDAIVYATGFRVNEYMHGLKVRGVGGRGLEKDWSEGASAYLGITVAGYPNLFLLMGPNTGLGHNSMVFMIESQVAYVIDAIKTLIARGLRVLDVQRAAQQRFDDEVQARLTRTVWATGCQSWYLGENGRNSTTWPGFTFEYRARTKRFDAENYALR
ncbi:MAG: flavin-containing monooxygenase [Polyangiales bacterium]